MNPDKGGKSRDKKSAIEQSALMNEIIKWDNQYYSINKNFHLDLKTCTKYTLNTSF